MTISVLRGPQTIDYINYLAVMRMHCFLLLFLLGLLSMPVLAQSEPEKAIEPVAKIRLDLVQPPVVQKAKNQQPIQLITSQKLPIKRPKAIFCRMEDAMTKGLKRKVKLGVEGS